MAAKKGDDIENNDDLNDQSSADFGDGDDSFGLPDVDYKPLEDSDDDLAEDSEIQSEEIQDEINASDSSEYESETSSSYDENDTESEGENDETATEYVPGSYSKPEEESSNVGKVVGIVVILVLAALSIWYFVSYRPAQQAEQDRIEQIEKQEEAKKLEQEKKAKAERDARIAAEQEAARLAQDEADAEPESGTVETINSRTGRFYIVVASALDGDLAMDYANKLAGEGLSISIIPPFGTGKFHRISVDDADTWAAAESRASELKSEYGEDVWVIKY